MDLLPSLDSSRTFVSPIFDKTSKNSHSLLPAGTLAELEDEAIRAWRDLFAVTSLPIREAVATMAKEGAEPLTEEFYDRMQQNPRAAGFLDQERVQHRLRASLRQWIIDLFSTLDAEQIPSAIKRQIEIGVVHARIRLPVDLIPAGIRMLKCDTRRRIDFAPQESAERLFAQIYVPDMHLADGLMDQANFRDTQDVVRNDEANRLMTNKHSASFERARQRAALSEWAESLLLLAWYPLQTTHMCMRDSEFDIWLHHKGAVMFEDSDDIQTVVDAIDPMNTACCRACAEPTSIRKRWMPKVKRAFDEETLGNQPMTSSVARSQAPGARRQAPGARRQIVEKINIF